MKKVLVFLLVCLSSTVLFGQTHWTKVNAPDYGGIYMNINTVIVIDGVEQQDANLEFGVFTIDEVTGKYVCRGVKYPPRTLPNGRVYYATGVYGQTGESYIYAVYDHATGDSLCLETVFTEDYPQVSFEPNGMFGALRTPWEAHFITVSSGIEKDIAAYEGESDRWYLISSPVGEVNPEDVTNMLENNYDLYYFDQAADSLEWINRKTEGGDVNEDFGNLQVGKGYLYANDGGGSATVTLTFPGAAYTEDVTVTLVKTEGKVWSGWNLIGNPFNEQVSRGDHPFYVMNEDGTEVEVASERTYLEPMEGAFVIAEEDGEMLTLSLAASGEGNQPGLALNVTKGRSVVDRAVVRFGEGRTLPKFQLNPNHTKVYIPQEGTDYAVVRAGEMGEMPVNFKAEKSGTYTMSFSSREVSFEYLHLVDNMTGADVNLLEVPAYTFDARTTDYASRFKLVFATGNSDDENFAYFNNGNLIVSNDGEATLQVVDVMGRILSSETVSGTCTKHIDAAKGVYMVRLINGNDVKVQKIVVE